MYPPQTSLIPATVALARFIEAHGFSGKYPFWYLGTTPVKYLTGPIVSSVLIGLHKVFPQFSFFDLSFFILIFSFLFSSIGWGLFTWHLSKNRGLGLAVGVITLILPWHWISGLALSELSSIAAASLTPWVLLTFFRFTINDFRFTILLLPAAIFALLLLTNTVSAIPAIIGLIILAILLFKKWEEGLKRVGLIIILGWALTLWWYSPAYWINLLFAPSLGGRSALSAFFWVLNLFRGFLPIILAAFAVTSLLKKKSLFQRFALSWLLGFSMLTLFRFFADPKFWLDWISWFPEVEIGLALVASYVIYNLRFRIYDFSNSKKTFILHKSLIIILVLCLSWFFAWQNRSFWLPRKSIENTPEFRVGKFLNNTVNCQPKTVNCGRVFLSGTTAFWLNSLYDIPQVRGGVDQASVGSKWREIAWEIRQGKDPTKSEKLLRDLQIKYIVVHDASSKEFYHDFDSPEKFENSQAFIKIYVQEGDVIYQVQ